MMKQECKILADLARETGDLVKQRVKSQVHDEIRDRVYMKMLS